MRRLANAFRCVVLSIGFAMVDPDEIEKLMAEAQRPRIAHVIPLDNDDGDDLLRQFFRGSWHVGLTRFGEFAMLGVSGAAEFAEAGTGEEDGDHPADDQP